VSQQPVPYTPRLLAHDLRLQEPELAAAAETIWQIVWRRRWRSLFVFLGICSLGAAALLLMKPTYAAHAVMAVASTQPDLAATDQVSPTIRGSSSTESDVESQIQLMTSNQALLKIAQDLHLNQEGELLASIRNWRSVTLAFFRHKWASLVEANWNDFFTLAPWQQNEVGITKAASASADPIIDFLRSRLKIQPITKSTTIDISFTSSDAETAAKVANAVAENYIENRQSARTDQARRATKYLRKRADQLLTEVTTAEKAVEDARAANVLRDGRDIQQLSAEMEKANAQLAASRIAQGVAKSKLEVAEARVRQVGIVGALEPGQSRLVDRLREMATEARTKLASSLTDHGAGHPESQKAEREYNASQSEVVFEAQARMSRLRSDVSAAAQQVEMLEASLQGFRADYDRLSAAVLVLKGLERQAVASRAIYEAFLNRLKQTEQVGFNEAENWIISPATPPANPSSPNTMLIVCATLALGAGTSVSLALLSEYRTRETIISSQHIAERGLRALGIVPDLGKRRSSLKHVLVATNHRKNSAFSEAVGSIFTSIMEMTRHQHSSTVILVTSSLPFEGKSTTATALAAKIAKAGQRVLLIDADLRAPRLHRAFGIKNDRGLSQCLHPTSCPSDFIYFDAKTDISILTAGPRHPQPQNALRSVRMSELIEEWRTSYDFIVIDSPPVLPISDARILAPLSDLCLFVTRWRKTHWKVAQHALAILGESGARLAGVVVSKVDVKQLATYGFADSQVYGREYRRYSSLAHADIESTASVHRH
jgi:succinoglycan biosynthesis transport protein ExoP